MNDQPNEYDVEESTGIDSDGREIHWMRLPCGCPIDSGCDSYHMLDGA